MFEASLFPGCGFRFLIAMLASSFLENTVAGQEEQHLNDHARTEITPDRS